MCMTINVSIHSIHTAFYLEIHTEIHPLLFTHGVHIRGTRRNIFQLQIRRYNKLDSLHLEPTEIKRERGSTSRRVVHDTQLLLLVFQQIRLERPNDIQALVYMKLGSCVSTICLVDTENDSRDTRR
jgi:hypothetical protein